MSLAAFSVAACDEKDPEGTTPSNPTQPVTPENPADPTNPTTPTEPGNPEKPTDPNTPAQVTVESVLKSALDQSYAAIEYRATVGSEEVIKYYGYDTATQTKGGEITSKAELYVDEIRHHIQGNVADGALDFSFEQTTAHNDEDPSDYIWYEFLRDWHLFDVSGEDEATGKYNAITDFSDKTLNYTGSMENEIPVDLTELGGLPYATDLSFVLENYTMLALADEFDALVIENGEAKINLITLIYNGVQAVNALIDSVNENTTVGQLFANPTFKAILSAVVNPIPAEKLPEVIRLLCEFMEVSGTLEEYEVNLSDVFFAPEEGITSYEYLVQVINYEQARAAAEKILKNLTTNDAFVLETPVSMATVKLVTTVVGEIIGEDLSDFDGLKEMAKEYIEEYAGGATQTAFTLSLENNGYVNVWDEGKGESLGQSVTLPDETYTFNSALITYTLDGSKIVSQHITAEVTHNYVSLYSEDKDGYNYRESVCEITLDCTVGYFGEEFTLIDIDGCATKYIPGDEPGVYYSNTVSGIVAGEEGTRVEESK